MRYSNRQSVAVVAVLALLSTAATCNGGRTPEGSLALYGTRIAETVASTQEAVGAIGKASQNQQVREGAVKALEGLDKINQLGTQLADKLELIHQARQAGGTVTGASVQDALKIIDAIDAAVDLEVIPKLGDYPETKAALQAAREISKLILTIQFELGRTQ